MGWVGELGIGVRRARVCVRWWAGACQASARRSKPAAVGEEAHLKGGVCGQEGGVVELRVAQRGCTGQGQAAGSAHVGRGAARRGAASCEHLAVVGRPASVSPAPSPWSWACWARAVKMVYCCGLALMKSQGLAAGKQAAWEGRSCVRRVAGTARGGGAAAWRAAH